jgi:type VI secretion system protein ImpK
VPSRGPTLKQLLAPEERNGLLQVEEDGGRTLVTLSATRSLLGQCIVGSTHEATLARVAAAVNQVPGRVLVVGHTDDQPIQSFRYRDNFDLSRERAVSVARLLQRG